LIERVEIMAVARGAKKTGSTKCETNILQSKKVGEVGMTKSEVKKALDEIRDMSDEEIADNGQFIRKVSEEALALIKNLEKR